MGKILMICTILDVYKCVGGGGGGGGGVSMYMV